jgi:hypothetical protein
MFFSAQATFAALQATYDFLTPDLWQETRFEKNPLQEFTDFLAKPVGHDSVALASGTHNHPMQSCSNLVCTACCNAACACQGAGVPPAVVSPNCPAFLQVIGEAPRIPAY